MQSDELENARRPDYTVQEIVDFPDANYQTIASELELLPGLWVIPTPGHTAGHQSIIVRCGDGSVVLAGQAHDTATEFAADLRAAVAGRERSDIVVPPYRAWMDRLLAY